MKLNMEIRVIELGTEASDMSNKQDAVAKPTSWLKIVSALAVIFLVQSKTYLNQTTMTTATFCDN